MRGSRTVWAAALFATVLGCGQTGFVEMAAPAPPALPDKPLPVYAARDIGRAYVVLGYVFRTTEGHRSGLEPISQNMYVMSPGSEEMIEVRRQALARGADAVVGLEMFPTLNSWGQPVGFSVGGLAVKFVQPEASASGAEAAVVPLLGNAEAESVPAPKAVAPAVPASDDVGPLAESEPQAASPEEL